LCESVTDFASSRAVFSPPPVPPPLPRSSPTLTSDDPSPEDHVDPINPDSLCRRLTSPPLLPLLWSGRHPLVFRFEKPVFVHMEGCHSPECFSSRSRSEIPPLFFPEPVGTSVFFFFDTKFFLTTSLSSGIPHPTKTNPQTKPPTPHQNPPQHTHPPPPQNTHPFSS